MQRPPLAAVDAQLRQLQQRHAQEERGNRDLLRAVLQAELRAQAARGAAPPRSARARARPASHGDAVRMCSPVVRRAACFQPSWLGDAHGTLWQTGAWAAAAHPAQFCPGARAVVRALGSACAAARPCRGAQHTLTLPSLTLSLPYTPGARLSSSRFQAVCGSMEWLVAGWCGGPFFRR